MKTIRFAVAAFLLMATITAEAQTASTRLSGAQDRNLKIADILSNPSLIPSRTDCKVIEFTISFLPSGEDLYGPFVVKGDKIPAKQLEYLQKHKGVVTRIFVEAIRQQCGDKTEASDALVYDAK